MELIPPALTCGLKAGAAAFGSGQGPPPGPVSISDGVGVVTEEPPLQGLIFVRVLASPQRSGVAKGARWPLLNLATRSV